MMKKFIIASLLAFAFIPSAHADALPCSGGALFNFSTGQPCPQPASSNEVANLQATIANLQSTINDLKSQIESLKKGVKPKKDSAKSSSEIDSKLKDIKKKIDDLKTKHASDLKDIYSEPGVTQDQTDSFAGENIKQYRIDLSTLEAQYDSLGVKK